MRIKRLKLRNYRTFEELELDFSDFYAALCGQNDAGKSNIIRALLVLLGPEDPYFVRRRRTGLNFETDYPKWLDDKSGSIEVSCDIIIDKEVDAGLYIFIKEWCEIAGEPESITVSPRAIAKKEANFAEFSLTAGDKEFKGLKAQEVQNRLRSTLIVHNSTESDALYSFIGDLDEFSVQYGSELSDIAKKASASLKRVAKAHKAEITQLLGSS